LGLREIWKNEYLSVRRKFEANGVREDGAMRVERGGAMKWSFGK
jgi:hypothetical protein